MGAGGRGRDLGLVILAGPDRELRLGPKGRRTGSKPSGSKKRDPAPAWSPDSQGLGLIDGRGRRDEGDPLDAGVEADAADVNPDAPPITRQAPCRSRTITQSGRLATAGGGSWPATGEGTDRRQGTRKGR